MKVIVVLSILVSLALARPQDDANAEILRYDSNNIGVGEYTFSYETSNGIQHEEQAQLENAGSDDEAIAVRGSYSYTSPEGELITVTYIADRNGFQPQGDHIPQPLQG